MTETKKNKTALVVGGGAFGTSIASVLSYQLGEVFIQVRDESLKKELCEGRNEKYLKGQKIPGNLTAFSDFSELDLDSLKIEVIVSALPMPAIQEYFSAHRELFQSLLKRGMPMISLAKGIDSEKLLLADDLFFELFNQHRDQFCFLSGPSFASEIVEKQITLVSLAGRSREHLKNLADLLETPYFKVFPTYDIKGLLLGGALKNILAIAAGMIEGLGYNHNTRAAMLTRGITEMLRFGKVFNARPETFYGLSGMGDLILTATGGVSRNRWFGMKIAEGMTPKEIFEKHHVVVEGYKTTKAAYLLAEKYEIHTRIFGGLYQVLYEGRDIREAIAELMALPPKFED